MIFLAERGLYYQVQECLKFPAQKCPDLLALALIQSNSPLSMVRHEMISGLIPIFLGNHSNAAVILHHAWNHQVLFYSLTIIRNYNFYINYLYVVECWTSAYFSAGHERVVCA